MQTVENPSRRRLFRGQISAPSPKIRLPYTVEAQLFTSLCTQCNKCYSACETKVIVKDEFGFPHIDFSIDECTLCGQCEQVCDQPLFLAQEIRDVNAPFNANININDKCLATNQIFCQSCQDVCDSQAISFQYIDSPIPVANINNEQCNTCGACVSTCPQNAIVISPQKEVRHG